MRRNARDHVNPLAVFDDACLAHLALLEQGYAPGHDPLLPAVRIEGVVSHAFGGMDQRDPRVSPLYAAFPNPPPVSLQVGTTEILRDDNRRMAAVLRRVGCAVTLAEWRDVPYVWQVFDGYIPEARAALREVAAFLAGVEALAVK